MWAGNSPRNPVNRSFSIPMADRRKTNGGARPGSGRKSKAEEMGLAALLDKCFTTEMRQRCFGQLALDCLSDDFHERNESRKLLLAYTFGKPRESVEHSGIDGEPFEIIVRHVTTTTQAPV